jgi:hypothetical protein
MTTKKQVKEMCRDCRQLEELDGHGRCGSCAADKGSADWEMALDRHFECEEAGA